MSTGAPLPPQFINPPPRSVAPLDMARPAPPARSNPTWATTLVFCCLIIGVLAAWIRFEQGVVKFEQNRSLNFATELTLAEGRSEDLGNLLADPKTQMVELVGSATSPVHFGSLAWNGNELRGVLFSDRLPPVTSGGHYLLYGISAANDQHLLAQIDPRAGASVYPFRPTDRVGPIARFELRDSSANQGGLVLSGNAP